MDNTTQNTDPFAGMASGVQDGFDPFSGMSNQAVVDPASVTAKLTPVLGALATTDTSDIRTLNDVSQAANKISQGIQITGSDANLRAAAADRAMQADPFVQKLNQTGLSMTDQGRAALASIQQKKQEAALEQQAVDRIQQLAVRGNETQAQILLDNYKNGGPIQYISDMNTKQLVMQRELEKAGIDSDKQSWVSDFAWFIAGAVAPIINTSQDVGNVDLPGLAKKSWLQSLFNGSRTADESSALYSLSPDDFSKYVREQLIPNIKNSATIAGFTDQSKVLNTLTELQTPSRWYEKDFQNGLDNLGMIPWVRPLSKAVSLPLLLTKNGARDAAAAAVTNGAQALGIVGEDALKKTTGLSADDITNNLLHSALNPASGATPVVPLATDASQALSRGEELISKLGDIQGPGRLSDEELKAKADAFIKTAQEHFGDYAKDISVVPQTNAVGTTTNQIEITLGKKSGGGYKDAATAQRYLGSMGYKIEPVTDDSGQVFGKVRLTIPETGAYANPLAPRVSGPIDAYLRSGRNLSDPVLADMAVMSQNTKQRIDAALVKPIVDNITALSHDEKKSLGTVLSLGRQNRQWYTNDDLAALYNRNFNRLPTDKEIAAYHSARDLNDIEYYLRNEDVWGTKARQGYQTGSFRTDGANDVDRANVIPNFKWTGQPKYRTFDTVTGQHFTSMTAEEADALRSQGRVLVTTEEPVLLGDGTRIKSFLVNKADLQLEDLRKDQIAYNPGGHTIYTGKYFPKQADFHVQPDTPDKKTLLNPNVYGSFDTRAQANFWADNMEKARQLYVEHGAEAKELIERGTSVGSHASLPSVDEFMSGFEKGWWRSDTPFEVCYDREMPTIYNKVDADAIDFANRSESGIDGYMRTNGRLYYGKRGDQLPDFMGRPAEVLDPYETLNRSLSSVARLSSFSDYKESAINRWVETYKDYMTNYRSDASPVKLFQEGLFAENKGPIASKVALAANTQRNIIKRTLGWSNAEARKSDVYAMRIADFVAGNDPDNMFRTNLSKKFTNWWESTSPTAFLRGFAFNTKLGLFNPAQFILQAATAFSSASVAGAARGGQAMFMVPLLRSFMLKGGGDDLLEEFIRRGAHGVTGFDNPKEFKAFMNMAKTSGFMDFGTSHGLINSYGPNATLSSFGSAIEKTTAAGRFFFNEGEMLNRIVAARLAWDDAKEAATMGSTKFRQVWAGRAEDWAGQMSKSSAASWQEGIMSIPTQFMAYNARVMELLLGKTFTPQQRVRLAIAQMGLAGSAGLPLTYELVHQYQSMTGDTTPSQIGTVAGDLNRGVIDSLIYHTTGADVQVGERIGTGNFISDTVRSIFGFSAYGEKNADDIFGGAGYSMAKTFFGDLTDVARWAVAESGGNPEKPITRDALLKLANNISTMSNISKSYMIMKYGMLVSNKGSVLATDVPTVDGFAQAMGFSSGKALSAGVMSQYVKDKKQQSQDLATQIVNLRTKAFVEKQEPEDYIPQINALVQLAPVDVRQSALVKANRQTPQALYDSVANRYKLAKQKEALQDAVEQQSENQ